MKTICKNKKKPRPKWVKKLLDILYYICLLLVMITIIIISIQETAIGDTYQPTIVATTTPTISNQDQILTCLAKIESGERADIKVMDGGSYSYGKYQFKISTLKDLYPEKTNDQLRAIALDPIQAREIAKDLLFNKGEWWRWGNSIRKMFQGEKYCEGFEPDLLNPYLEEIGTYAK